MACAMMEARYDPEAIEERWQRRWEAEGLYAAGALSGSHGGCLG